MVESDRGRFFFFQSASNPFGFVKLRPDTSTNTLWGTGYKPSENEVKGFSHLHDWQLSGVQVMPTTGDVPKTEGDTGWQSHVDHTNELAQAGYHRLHLDRYGITAELTTTDRVGMHRYTYDKPGPSEIIINLGGVLGEAEMLGSQVTQDGPRALEGYVDQRGTLTDGQYYGQINGQRNRLFFRIEFDTPLTSVHALGGDDGVYVRFDRLKHVQMKVALSLTGTDGARRNLQAELPGWNFDAVKRASQKRWNDWLGGSTSRRHAPAAGQLLHRPVPRALCAAARSHADGRYLDDT